MSATIRRAFVAGLILAFAGPALAEGDVENGKKVFRKCQACHAVEEGAPSKAGPNLHGILGRKSAAVEDFKYSAPMIKLGEEGHIWTAEEIDRFIENPKKAVAGTKMSFAGLKKAEERADVIAYLTTLSSGEAAPAEAAPAEETPAQDAPAEAEGAN